MTHQGIQAPGVNWNTLRDMCQNHALEAHGSQRFTTAKAVKQSWLDALRAFQSGSVHIRTDGDIGFRIPEFDLTATS